VVLNIAYQLLLLWLLKS